jgi:hypothetical protein
LDHHGDSAAGLDRCRRNPRDGETGVQRKQDRKSGKEPEHENLAEEKRGGESVESA